jgi:hypothetical protein
MNQHDGATEPGAGEAVFDCFALGAVGAVVAGAAVGVLAGGWPGLACCGLVAAYPGALAGAALGSPVAAYSGRLGRALAVVSGLVGGAALSWLLLEAASAMGGG